MAVEVGCVVLAIVLAACISGAEGVRMYLKINMLHFSACPGIELTSLGDPRQLPL